MKKTLLGLGLVSALALAGSAFATTPAKTVDQFVPVNPGPVNITMEVDAFGSFTYKDINGDPASGYDFHVVFDTDGKASVQKTGNAKVISALANFDYSINVSIVKPSKVVGPDIVYAPGIWNITPQDPTTFITNPITASTASGKIDGKAGQPLNEEFNVDVSGIDITNTNLGNFSGGTLTVSMTSR